MGWKDDPFLTHFAGKARETEHATRHHHDASREKGLQGGDGAKILK